MNIYRVSGRFAVLYQNEIESPTEHRPKQELPIIHDRPLIKPSIQYYEMHPVTTSKTRWFWLEILIDVSFRFSESRRSRGRRRRAFSDQISELHGRTASAFGTCAERLARFPERALLTDSASDSTTQKVDSHFSTENETDRIATSDENANSTDDHAGLDAVAAKTTAKRRKSIVSHDHFVESTGFSPSVAADEQKFHHPVETQSEFGRDEKCPQSETNSDDESQRPSRQTNATDGTFDDLCRFVRHE